MVKHSEKKRAVLDKQQGDGSKELVVGHVEQSRAVQQTARPFPNNREVVVSEKLQVVVVFIVLVFVIVCSVSSLSSSSLSLSSSVGSVQNTDRISCCVQSRRGYLEVVTRMRQAIHL